MKKDANIYDIAKLVGVSKSTVSRVINGHTGVSDDTRKRVLKAIEDNAYIPNNSARSLSSLSTQTVVLLVCGITNPFFSKIISLILEKMNNANIDVVLHSYEPGFDANIIDAAISICKEKRPKGIILLGGIFEENHQMLRIIGVPIVMATVTASGDGDRSWFSSVTIDDEDEGRKIAEYVCRNGHRKIAIIGQHYWREAGMKKVFKQYGITADVVDLEYDRAYSFRTGYKAAKRLLKKSDYTCLLCLSDVFAIGAIKAVQEKGLRVPEDISIVGFDGIENGAYTNPALTTFVQPFEEIAGKSVSILLGIVNNGMGHEHFIVETSLEEGGSFKAV